MPAPTLSHGAIVKFEGGPQTSHMLTYQGQQEFALHGGASMYDLRHSEAYAGPTCAGLNWVAGWRYVYRAA